MDAAFNATVGKRLPKAFLAAAAALLLVGLSALQRGDELVGKGETCNRQLIWLSLAIPVFLGTIAVPYRWFDRLAIPIYLATTLLLIVTLFMPVRHGSRRWIPLVVFDLQPSELAKIAVVLMLARMLRHGGSFRRPGGLIRPLMAAAVPMLLILKEPDLGTSLLFLPVWFAMLFAAGARFRHLAAAAVMGFAALPVLWSGMSAEQRSRVVAVFTQEAPDAPPTGDGYHLHQSKRMLAAGGVWGSEISGMLSADPTTYHLPAGRTDFIFCLVGERWGLLGCMTTLALFGIFISQGIGIALRCREPFGRLVAVGIVTLLATQVIINTGMTVGLLPITGLTLPLMSYGGSSLLATIFCIGLLVNISLRPANTLGPMPFQFGVAQTRPAVPTRHFASMR